MVFTLSQMMQTNEYQFASSGFFYFVYRYFSDGTSYCFLRWCVIVRIQNTIENNLFNGTEMYEKF